MSKKNEQTVQQSVDTALEKTPAQVEVLELDEAMLDIVSGGIALPADGNGKCANINILC